MSEAKYPYTVYRFRVINEVTGKPFTTRYEMTEAEAHARYRVIERIEHSARVVTGPSGNTSDVIRK